MDGVNDLNLVNEHLGGWRNEKFEGLLESAQNGGGEAMDGEGREGAGGCCGRRSLTTSALCLPVDGHRLRQPGAYSFLIRDNQTPCPFWLQKGQRNPDRPGSKFSM